MATKKQVVWVWNRSDGRPAYVGYGERGEFHPAQVIWEHRFKVDSQLTRWLQSLSTEPRRTTIAGQYSRREAAAIAQSYRVRYNEQGIDLLDSRPKGSRTGGGKNRCILGPGYSVYNSVRHAAAETGVCASTITRRCQQPDTDWDYLD
jgi:hypothetical protein